jgi:hypothetical protein
MGKIVSVYERPSGTNSVREPRSDCTLVYVGVLIYRYKNNKLQTILLTKFQWIDFFIKIRHNTTINDILKKFQIIDYYRYADILIIYNTLITNTDNTLSEFNNIHPKIKFTMEKK